MKKILSFCTILILFCSCKEKQNEKTATNTIGNHDAAVVVTMENQTHTLHQKDINPINIAFEKDTLQLVFFTNDDPFQLNLNLNNTDIINKGSATYTIPEANASVSMVDLNFFNAKRKGKIMNRRIVFREGTINIQKLTKNKLQMTFDGEGGGMMDRKNSFPISGKVNVTY